MGVSKQSTTCTTPSVILLLLICLFCCCHIFVVVVEGQSPIPAKYDGFVYKNRSAITDTIIIEAFYDPVCPDSRDSWPPLKKAFDHYSPSSLSLIIHTFPLPYHDNAFLTSRALHIVNGIDSSATFSLLQFFFDDQEKFFNAQTVNKSRESVVNQVTEAAARAIGKRYYSALKSGFLDRKTDLATRSSFKYGCSRGVYGTPFFFVNGFVLPDGGSAIDYAKWRSIIDPLVGKDRA